MARQGRSAAQSERVRTLRLARDHKYKEMQQCLARMEVEYDKITLLQQTIITLDRSIASVSTLRSARGVSAPCADVPSDAPPSSACASKS